MITPLNAAAEIATASAEAPAILAGLRSKADPEHAQAITKAAALGPDAVPLAAPLLDDPDNETFRAAKRVLLAVVRHAGAGGSLGPEARKVEQHLLAALQQAKAAQARRDLVWMLSEVGADPTINALAALLADPDVHDDARCALERIPGKASLKALSQGLKQVPDPLKPALAESLRKRGEKVSGYPSQRLVPTKATSIKPGGE